MAALGRAISHPDYLPEESPAFCVVVGLQMVTEEVRKGPMPGERNLSFTYVRSKMEVWKHWKAGPIAC